jgi:hypothetical protein
MYTVSLANLDTKRDNSIPIKGNINSLKKKKRKKIEKVILYLS